MIIEVAVISDVGEYEPTRFEVQTGNKQQALRLGQFIVAAFKLYDPMAIQIIKSFNQGEESHEPGRT